MVMLIILKNSLILFIIKQKYIQPHRWQCSDGKLAYVQTPSIGRSKELLDL